MAGPREARLLGRLYGHGGALAIGAVEHELLAGRLGDLVQQPARFHVVAQIRVGGVHRAGDLAGALPLALFPQVDQHHVRIADQRHGVLTGERPTARLDVALRQADLQVGRHGHVHHLRVRQVQVVHQRHVFLDVGHLEARVEAPLLADGADRVALVVVARIDQRLVGQRQQLVEQRVVGGTGVAVLEIGAAGAADQQGVAGEHPVRHQIAVGLIGVAGRIDRLEADALDIDVVAVRDADRDHVRPAFLAHHGGTAGAVAQRAEAGDVVGVHVGVERLDQLEVEFAEQRQVTLDLVQHRIDDEGLAAWPAGQQVGVAAGDAVEQLAEDHDRLPVTLSGLSTPL